jgi:isopenicillin N synthase-like dioxygenase
MPAEPAVPILDLTPYTDGGADADARARAAAAMDAACRGGSGFIAARLPMAGVNEEVVRAAFAAAKELFDQPEDVKLKSMRRLTAETNCGYSPLSVEALDRARGPDCKEAFNVRKFGVHDNDYSGCPPSFAPAATALWDALESVALGTCECAADGLGLGDTSFFSRTLAR